MTSSPTPEPELTKTPRAIVPRNLALGIERIGFIPLSHRLISVIVFVALCALAAVGFARLKVDDSLSQLFRSDTAEYKTYEDVTQHFPSTEFDVLIVVEGAKLLERSSLAKTARSGDRPATHRRHARHDLVIFGAANRPKTAANSGSAVPQPSAGRRGIPEPSSSG